MRLPWDAERPRERPRSDQRYHSARWTKSARAYLMTHPLCAECQKEGRITPAKVVDHITPWPVCGDSGFWDKNNWQPLCQHCNIAKGNRDKKIIESWRSQQQY